MVKSYWAKNTPGRYLKTYQETGGAKNIKRAREIARKNLGLKPKYESEHEIEMEYMREVGKIARKEK